MGDAPSYDTVIGDLRRAYDAKVDERRGNRVDDWKDAERQTFLDRLRAEQRRTLLEVGAGTGVHGAFFAAAGMEVVCTDLSPAMVAACRAAGLDAHEQDFLHLDLGRTFDAAFAMNCLLHVPLADVPAALERIAAHLEVGGLFYWGQYGGVTREGILAEDHYEPKRFFASMSDDDVRAVASTTFEVLELRTIDLGDDELHFQSLTLRR